MVPLDLAITPMRVLQDPLIGPVCSGMFEEGDVDDRFLMILFLTVERLRKNSSWKPYVIYFQFAKFSANFFTFQLPEFSLWLNIISGTLICFRTLLVIRFGLVMTSFQS